jgi:NTP pyrophosphatase (non-canonical NTP hydrolase)
MANELMIISQRIKRFVDERDWAKYHNHKDVALSLVQEAAEVLEHFQWLTLKEAEKYAAEHREEIADELADVTAYLFTLADKLDVNLKDAVFRKMKKNELKYPAGMNRGRYRKVRAKKE